MRCPFASVVILLLAAAPVCADGMMTPRMTQRILGQSFTMVESPRQEALIVLDKHAGIVTVSLRTHFHAGPTDLAWVIPVPVKPESIEEGNEDVFRALESGTAPEFLVFTPTGSKFGCGGNASSRVDQIVSVVDVGTAGIFNYVVLSASGTEALVSWLNDNDYRIPTDADRVFRRYVELGSHWLAIQLRAEVKNQSTLAPHPITYSYRSTKIEYPLVISSLSATDQIEVVLYVLADCEYGSKNWANAQIDSQQLALDDASPSGTNYETLVRKLTADHGGYLFVTEFASDLDTVGHRPLLAVLRGLDSVSDVLAPQKHPQPFYLTRLRAVVTKAALDRDVVLVPTRVSQYDFVLNYHRIFAPRDRHTRSVGWAGTLTFLGVLAVLYYTLLWRRCV